MFMGFYIRWIIFYIITNGVAKSKILRKHSPYLGKNVFFLGNRWTFWHRMFIEYKN